MSLINEALKKAQRDRPGAAPATPPPAGPPGQPPPVEDAPRPKGKGFLWGFILAVVLVGGVSSLLAAYLVLTLLEPSPKPEEKASVQPVASVALSPEASGPAIDTAEAVLEEPTLPTQTQAAATAPTVAAAESPEPVAPRPDASTAVTAQPQPVSPPSEEESVNEPATPSPAQPDAEVVARLMQLQIRGIMTGGTKVLIQDLSTNRTRAYREGDPIEGTFGLVVETITSSTIKFRDNAGFLHTKSF